MKQCKACLTPMPDGASKCAACGTSAALDPMVAVLVAVIVAGALILWFLYANR